MPRNKTDNLGFDATKFDAARTPQIPVRAVREPADATDLVVAVVNPRDELQLLGVPAQIAKQTEKLIGSPLLDALKAQGLSAEKNAVTAWSLPGLRIIAVGLGDDPDVSHETIRRASGAATRYVLGNSAKTTRRIALSLELAGQAQLVAAVEGALLAAGRFHKLSGEAAGESALAEVQIVTTDKAATQAIEHAKATTQAVLVARDWANVPPNLLAPADFVEQAKGLFADAKVDIEVLDERALQRGGYGGLLAVGGGSSRPPRLLRIAYRPRGAKQHLALVGKGITFDSGGYSLKPTDSMLSMKTDMSGAADVICALRAIVELGLKVNVTAYAMLAENLVSSTAYRPSDVLRMYDGTTVENRNSDAEGRIVLADGLARASEDEPDLIVDVATLTGACVVALGSTLTGLFASSDAVADQLLDAAEASGEAMWQLPITDEVRNNLPSKVADIQSGAGREGSSLFAAAFLQHFVGDGLNWAHLDIAGPAWNSGSAHDYVPADATGAIVRTLIALAEKMN